MPRPPANNVEDLNQPNHENASQTLLDTNSSYMDNASNYNPEVPGPSRPRSEHGDNQTNEFDFSSGSSDIWQPEQMEEGQEQSSSDSETILKHLESQEVNVVNHDNNIQRVQTTQNKRKKGHGPMQRKLRKIRSECRKKGEEYVTAKGKSIAARTSSYLPANCRAKCFLKTQNLDLLNIYTDYRNLPSRDSQKRYLSGLITIKQKERTRTGTNIKNREITVLYTLNGAEGHICKNCYIKVFGESRGFVDAIIKKLKNTTTSVVNNFDLRTVRQHPGNRRSELDIIFARDFINSIPAYESHYSRNHTSKRYLEKSLNLQVLYGLYKEKFVNARSDESAKPLSISVFRNVFKSLNLKFKKPSNDTCKTCDSFALKIKSCVSDECKQQLEVERTEHQTKAAFHYETKRLDKDKSLNSDGRSVVVAFDLQKCLATPYLTASVSFYKRKLWTFNLTVRNITTKRTSCYIWHEGVAQRGADEIASSLWHFIKDLPDSVEEITLYSDTCPGQNRNNILAVMFMIVLQQKTTLKKINHKFLVPGHTHLECDTDHAAIERFIKHRNSTISVPQDWASVIKMTSNRFDVKFMSQSDFFAFSKLLSTYFIKRNITKDKTSFAWNSIFWLMYERSNDVGFKYTLNPDDPFRFFSMCRRGRSFSIADIELPVAYSEPLNIDLLKYNDIQDLLPFIDPIYHDFYKSLKHVQSRTSATSVSDSEEDYE